MADSYITKRALAEAMKELMLKHPMEKIKIRDIVELCNMTRQSFYYHFKDKYDLVNWIFYTEFVENIQNILGKSGWILIEKMCIYFYENKEFYVNALKVRGQNSFSEYFNEVMHPIIYAQFEDIFKDDKNSEFYATFFSDAIRVAITRWLQEEIKMKPDEFVRLIKMAVKGLAYKLINDIEKEKAEH